MKPRLAPAGWVTCDSCARFPYRFFHVTRERWPFQVAVVQSRLLEYFKHGLGTIYHPLMRKISKTTYATSVASCTRNLRFAFHLAEHAYSENAQSTAKCDKNSVTDVHAYARRNELYLFYVLSVRLIKN